MKVTTERLPKSLVALDIELDQQQVSKGLERAARKLSQQYRIPGFRPGKAPRFIVENYLGRDRIMEEASDDLMNAAIKDALKAESLAPVGQLKLDSFAAEPFHFRVLVPVEPTVELAPYTTFRMPLEQEPVTDESVQKLLNAQREQHVVLKSLETPRPAQEGDLVSVRITSDLDQDDDEDEDDVALPDEDEAVLTNAEGEDENDAEDEDDEDDEEPNTDLDEVEKGVQQIVLESGRTRPEFLSALLGSQPGDTRIVTVTYDDDDANEALRGQTVTYTLEVNQIQERILPDWEELPTLTNFEGDFEGMRTKARARLEHAASEKARRTLLDRFMERASSDSIIELPDAMIEERATELFHEQVAQFKRYGLTEDQLLQSMGKTHEEAVADYTEQAERDLRTQLILREIIKRENITLDDAEVAAELEHFLEDYESSRHSEIRTMLETPQMQRVIASTALDRKLRDRIVELSTAHDGEAAIEQEAGTTIEQGPDAAQEDGIAEGQAVRTTEGTAEAQTLGDLVGTATVQAEPQPVLEASEGALGEDEPVTAAPHSSEPQTSGV